MELKNEQDAQRYGCPVEPGTVVSVRRDFSVVKFSSCVTDVNTSRLQPCLSGPAPTKDHAALQLVTQ